MERKQLLNLCRDTNIEEIKKCIFDDKITNNNIFSVLSAPNTSLEAFKCLIMYVYDVSKFRKLLQTLCKNNHLEKMKILLHQYNFTINVTNLITIASNANNYEIVSWLLDYPPNIERVAFTQCLKYGNLKLMEKFIKKQIKIFSDDFIVAIVESDIEWKEKLLFYKNTFSYKPSTIGKLLNKCNYNDEKYNAILNEYGNLLLNEEELLLKEIYDQNKLFHLAKEYNLNIDKQLCKIYIDNFDMINERYNNDLSKFQTMLDTYIVNKNACMIKKLLLWSAEHNMNLSTLLLQENLLSRTIDNIGDGKWLYDKFTIIIGNRRMLLLEQNNNNKKRKREDDVCCICLEESNAYTNCEHTVCLKCVTQLSKPICPICRSSIENIIKQQKITIIE